MSAYRKYYKQPSSILEPDGLLPLTNLPLGPTTAIAEHLALRHPIKVKTGRELWVLVERYRRKIVGQTEERGRKC